jgi:LCP family protein required for cell wall assembly
MVGAGLAALMAMAVACGSAATPGAAAGPERDTGTTPAADLNILVVGMDAGPDREGSRPDTMVVAHVPKSGDSAALVSLPRDLYVNGGKKFGRTKLNAIYPLALAAERRADPKASQQEIVQKAQADLVSVVQDFAGVRIDHYAQVDMAGFTQLSDVVGGVQVCLTNAVQDAYSGANFPAGKQLIKGKAALAFVRQRHGLPNGDLDRVKRQQMFLTGLVDTVVKGGALTNPTKRNALLTAVRKYVVLDQRWDLVSFAGQVRALSSSGVRSGTVPITGERTIGGMSVLTSDPTAVKGFFQSFLTTRATAGGQGDATSGQPDSHPGSACVN